ncbi:MAG: S8 family serine peptidase [Anaerolineae bacterium]|nr:S8 family serine peptidase [Anaerolineae bacterium]
MKRLVLLFVLMTVLLLAFSASVVGAQGAAKEYIIVSQSRFGVPSVLLNQIRQSGGIITENLSRMGVVVATSNNPRFENGLLAARAVVENRRIPTANPKMELGPDFSHIVSPPNTNDDDFFFDLEWGHTSIDAVRAWAMGRTGAGAIVAVLDEGVDDDHPDLASQVRDDLSASFVPGEDWDPVPGFYFNHGTHVAGTVAGADNAYGMIGVAPDAQIMAVKVLSEELGYGLDSWIIAGIIHAADHGADVINMSLGSGPIPLSDPEVQDYFLLYSLAALYANSKGTTVIASAGNDAFDFGTNADYIHLPSDAVGIISVSATAPEGWAVDPNNAYLRIPTSYTNYGANRIDFAAPGGDFDLPGEDLCTVAGLTRPCWVLDMVFSVIPGGWSWAAGTSMAAPHVAGVAAQIVGYFGGSANPAVVEAALRYTADQKPPYGYKDTYWGYGHLDSTFSDYWDQGGPG